MKWIFINYPKGKCGHTLALSNLTSNNQCRICHNRKRKLRIRERYKDPEVRAQYNKHSRAYYKNNRELILNKLTTRTPEQKILANERCKLAMRKILTTPEGREQQNKRTKIRYARMKKEKSVAYVAVLLGISVKDVTPELHEIKRLTLLLTEEINHGSN